MEQQLAIGDFAAIRQIAHCLKGVAGTLGLVKIQQLAAVSEQQAQMNDHGEESEFDLTALRQELPQLAAALKRVLADRAGDVQSPPEKKAVTWAQAQEVVDKLEVLLVNDDTGAITQYREAKEMITGLLGEDARKLERQIQNYDFTEALVTLQIARLDATKEAADDKES